MNMKEQEFIEREFAFLDNIKASALYQECKTLSDQINKDENLLRLDHEREEILKSADAEKDEEKKRALLIAYKEKDEEIRHTSLMQEYLVRYEKLRKILNRLTDGFIKEIYS